MDKNRLFLQNRFKKSKTIPGTRSHHAFIPLENGKFHISRVSGVGSTVTEYSNDRLVPDLDIEQVRAGSYVACQYERDWFAGIVVDASVEHNDVQVKFVHPKGPAKNFFWPAREDICSIPLQHVIKFLSCPTTKTKQKELPVLARRAKRSHRCFSET